MSQKCETEFAAVLDQLHEITDSVLNDLRLLQTNPLLASSPQSCQHVRQIVSKTQEVLQILYHFDARPIPRRKQAKSSKVSDTHQPSILQDVSMQQYQDMEKFAKQVLDVVETGASLNLPVRKSPRRRATDGHKRRHGHHHEHSTWCQRSYRHVVPTLEAWMYLLARAQNKEELGVRAPTSNSDHTEIVAHFQRLFDVPTEGGVYTRMNELYVRVGEMQNVLNSLRDVLGLDQDVSASSIVMATTQLCELYSGSTANLLGQLLQQERLDRVISRMEHYRRFFPVFDSVVKELMELLGVASIDGIVPAVRSLKLLMP